MWRLLALFLVVCCSVSMAQFGAGIQGTVIDASAKVMPGVRVRVVSVSTGVARDVVSSDTGVYRVPSLPSGEYTVSAESEGFQRSEQRVTVAIDEIRRVDFTMQVGNVNEKVNVVDKPVALETEQGRLSGRLDTEQLRSLPAPGRNVFNLLTLQPGVTGRGFGNDVYAGEPQPNVRAAGQRQESNFYSVDDTSINSISRGGTINLTPNIDSVAEVRVVTNHFSAEEGRNSGAGVQVLTKSGTNSFHGTVSEYFQNNTLSARNVFEAGVPVYRQHQFGYSLGGPVIRNRTFFFTSYEGLRNSGARASVATVETEQFRDFVARTRPGTIAATLLTKYRPIAYPSANFRDLGSPSRGVNAWSTAPDGVADVGSVTFVPINIRNGDQFNARLDHELRPGKDRLYGSWYRTKGYAENSGLRPDFVRPQTDIATFANLNHTHIFSPSVINEFRAGVIRLRGLPSTPNHLEVPNINVTGSSGYQNAGNFPGGWYQTSFTYRDTLSIIRGGHNVKAGGELRRMRNNLINTTNYVPAYTFASILDFADDEAIQMQRAVDPRTGEPAVSGSAIRVWEWALYLQDDWKIRRNLTINLGLRYENYGTMTDAQNRLRGFLFGSGSSYSERLANGRVDIVPQMWPADKLNLGPRFGFAWDIGGKGKNVLRGGYGVAYDRLATVVPGTYRGNPPLNAVATLGTQFGTNFTYTLGDPTKPYLGYPADPGLRLGLDERNGIRGARVQVVGVDPGFRNPYTHDWYLGLQRSLAGGFVVEAGYLGTVGHHLINVVNPNRFAGDLIDGRLNLFNPSFAGIQMSQSTSDSVYHGGTLTLRRQFSRGVSFQAAYTYGKVITDAEGAQAETQYQDANDRLRDRALASFDVPQRLSFAGVWDLPFFRSCASIGCKLAGGWQLAGYGVIEKGLPFSVFSSAPWPRGDFNADGSNADRPDGPTTQVKKKDYTRQEYLSGIFSASVFPLPSGGRPGTLGRNTFRGPGFARVDISFGKTFRVTERVGAFLRLEAFNAFNRVNLNAPITDLTNINFGRATSAQNPRSLQVSLQIRF